MKELDQTTTITRSTLYILVQALLSMFNVIQTTQKSFVVLASMFALQMQNCDPKVQSMVVFLIS